MNPVTRAFELARTGQYRTLEEIRRRLRQEKFESVDQHISGKSLGDQLKALMREAKRP